MIWFSLVVPIIVTISLVIFFHEKMDWWEYFLQFLIPVALIFGAKHLAIKSLTDDQEYWNNYAISATYDEPWNEYVHRTCTRPVSCGKNCSTTETYDCSYIDSHSAAWYMHSNSGSSHSISSSQFETIASLWKNRVFQDMHRNFHTRDGDRYNSAWNGKKDIANLISVTTTHTYENKIQVPNEVLNFQEVDSTTKAQYGLYDYNWGYSLMNFNPIKGDNNGIASKVLAMHNSLNGKSKELHLQILVFDGKPSLAGDYQEAYWKGGNKNEFNICIGKKGNSIEWVKVISWTTNEVLKVKVRDDIVAMDYDIRKIVDYVVAEVPKAFVRRDFKEYDYIDVQPSSNAVMWTLIATLIASIGLALFHVFNPWEKGGRRYRRHRRF